MGNKASISKDRILIAAYELAEEHGLATLGVREVATACGVSVGSVYNYYPTKADLVANVVELFWKRSLAQDALRAYEGEPFLSFCRRFSITLSSTVARFRDGWAGSAKSLDAKSLALAQAREEACFAHIEKGLRVMLERDESIDREALTGPLAPEPLCRFIWHSMLSAAQRNTSCDPLFALLERAIYTP